MKNIVHSEVFKPRLLDRRSSGMCLYDNLSAIYLEYIYIYATYINMVKIKCIHKKYWGAELDLNTV